MNFSVKFENEVFKLPLENLMHSNTSKQQWEEIRALTDDHTIVIKKVDKDLCVVVYDKTDIYYKLKRNFMILVLSKACSLKKRFQHILLKAAYKMFLDVKQKGLIRQKELRYFTYEF